MAQDSEVDERGWKPRLEAVEVPWLTLAVAATIVAIYVLQLRTAPQTCFENTAYPAVCAVVHLLQESPLAVLALPFVHGSVGHLAQNAAFLVFFGSYFEHRHTRARYLPLLLAAGYGSLYLEVALDALAGRPPLALGVSGAVFAVAASFGVTGLPKSHTDFDSQSIAALAFCFGGWLTVALAVATHLALVPTAPQTATGVHVVGVAVGLAYGVASRSDATSAVDFGIDTADDG